MGIARHEVVAQALQLERTGRKFYLEAAGKSSAGKAASCTGKR